MANKVKSPHKRLFRSMGWKGGGSAKSFSQEKSSFPGTVYPTDQVKGHVITFCFCFMLAYTSFPDEQVKFVSKTINEKGLGSKEPKYIMVMGHNLTHSDMLLTPTHGDFSSATL